MSFSGPVAGCNDSSHMAKKRRRWSTAHQETVLAPNRFGPKKQMRLLGRQLSSSASLSCSLASFQSMSNPIFESSAEEAEAAASYSSNNDCKPEAGERRIPCTWYNNPAMEVTLVNTPSESLSRRSPGRGIPGGGAELHIQQLHPKPKSRLGKISPESSLLSDQAAVGSGGEDDDHEIGIEDPILLVHSPAINGKRSRIARGLLEQPREAFLNDAGEGEWPEAVEEEIEGVNQRDSTMFAVSLNSEDDGAQSIEQPQCLIEYGSQQQQVDLLSALEASERRSRELVEKVQANAAAELAQLRAYKAVVEKLREDCIRHEAAAKEWSDLHRDTAAQLVSAREEVTELDRQRSLQAVVIEGFKEKEGVKRDLQDAMAVADQLKIETLEKEQARLRTQVQTLGTDLMAAESELTAAAMREVRREAEATEAAKKHEDAIRDAQMRAADSEGEIEDGSNRSPLESASEGGPPSVMKLREMEALLAAMSEQMERLQTERNELHIAAQNAERRVDGAHKERDAVVLAVQQEWDSVKVALRNDKEKLERELVVVREHNSQLQSQLSHMNKILQEDQKRQESRNLEADKAGSLQVYIGDKIVEPGTERGDRLIALWNEYQKLEAELNEAFDHNKKQRCDRETLHVALDGVRKGNKRLEGERQALMAALVGAREGNQKLEGELSHFHAEKAKLEGERNALMTTVQEERQRLESERAAVCKAMMGENEKLESEREVLLAMQEYLKKLEMKKELNQPVVVVVGGDEKRRRRGKRGAASQS